MDVLANTKVLIIQKYKVYQITRRTLLYTLKFYNVTFQFYLNKGGENDLNNKISRTAYSTLNKVGRLTLSDFPRLTYYKVTVIKTVLYWQKNI